MRKADYDKWYADKVQQVKDAEAAAAEGSKALAAQESDEGQ
jgi:hypothetical protein